MEFHNIQLTEYYLEQYEIGRDPWTLPLYSDTMSDNISYFFCIVSIGPVSKSNEFDIFGLDAEAKEEAYGVRFLAEGL